MQFLPNDLVLVSDDALLSRTVHVTVNERTRVRVASSIVEGLQLLRSACRVRAVILDGALFQGNAQPKVAELRAVEPIAPTLFVAPTVSNALINSLQPHGVQVVVRPLPAHAISVFVERALTAGRLEPRALTAWVKHLAAECRLTARDLALLPLVLDEEEPEGTCLRLGIDRPQLERSLRRLVKKCRVRNTDRLARNLMRNAYLLGSELTCELIEPARTDSL